MKLPYKCSEIRCDRLKTKDSVREEKSNFSAYLRFHLRDFPECLYVTHSSRVQQMI